MDGRHKQNKKVTQIGAIIHDFERRFTGKHRSLKVPIFA